MKQDRKEKKLNMERLEGGVNSFPVRPTTFFNLNDENNS